MFFKNFLKNSSGNIAMLFSLAAVPLLVGAGVAIDMSRINYANTRLQAAADSAALAAVSGKKDSLLDEKVNKLIAAYLKQNKADDIITSVKVTDAKFDEEKNLYHVKVTGKIDTMLLGLVGHKTVDVGAYSEVDGGNPPTLEMALVLDVTGSMNAEGRLASLKVAAKDMVAKILEKSPAASDLKIGIVPFADYVNVGTKYDGESWLDVPARPKKWECYNSYPNVTYFNCKQVPNLPVDGVAQSGTHEECESSAGKAVEVCGWYQNSWYGLVGSRTGNDTQLQKGGTPYPGIINASGAPAITDLTSNKSTLDTNINALTASGETYIPAGLMWGWELLDSNKPFNVAKTKKAMSDSKGIKALVLMTDGDNTKSADGMYHWGGDGDAADKKTNEICDNIKKDGITIYTVSFKVKTASSIAMLQECASNPGNAFDAVDENTLVTAFGAIADSLSAVRLTK
jgi:Flp pilus assembly protein TadG